MDEFPWCRQNSFIYFSSFFQISSFSAQPSRPLRSKRYLITCERYKTMDLGIQNIWLFILAGWALNLTPGPDVFYMVTHSFKSGWRAGAVAAAGITAGCFVHVAAATVGLSALITASATAFTVLKWMGAAYLVYVGWQMLRSKAPIIAIDSGAAYASFQRATGQNGYKKVFRQGFLTNVLNPKVALFFLAFLPQFVSPTSAHPSLAFLFLGVLFNLNAIPINLGYVTLAAWVSQRATALQRGMHWLERAAGALFISFGVKLALSARN
jgi:RhtB (resistance to homoserine/threonine) family protein